MFCGRKQAFGVPLYTQNRKRSMSQSFGSAVCGGLKDLQVVSRPVNALMMGTVYESIRAIKCVQNISFGNGRFVELVPALKNVISGVGHMLKNSAAKENVYDLHSLTDAKYGDVGFDGIFQGL